MIRIVLCAVLLLLPSLPVHAGEGTIKETDTEIIIEYTGENADKQMTEAEKVEQQRIEEQKEKTVESNKAIAAIHDARSAERRKDEE
jgi:hypothetical protein